MGSLSVLATGYSPPERLEPPVSRCRVAALFGVCPKTVDRWVSRDHMPPDGDRRGCWIMAGAQRRYYPSRVREWLAQQN